MLSEPIPIKDLDVVGYADAVAPELLPRVVPPVFRLRTAPDRVFMPPLRLVGALLVDAHATDAADFDSAVARGEATRLAAPLSARRNHALWVDEHEQVRYDPAVALADHLRALARRRVGEARRALVEQRVDDALRLAQVAICADNRCLEALLVKGFVQREQGQAGRIAVLARIAAAAGFEGSFDEALAEFSRRVHAERARIDNVNTGAHVLRPVQAFARAA
jgi:hypothetical protein